MSVRNNLEKLPENLWQDEGIRIKPIKSQEELIIALFDLQLREDQKDLVNPPSFSIGRAYLSPEDNVPCLIWNEGGEPIGFINFSKWLGQDAEIAHSWSYFIDREQQGKGYGKRAARMAVRLLQAANPEILIKLSTEAANQKAQALYLSLGFRQLPERDGDDLVFGLRKKKAGDTFETHIDIVGDNYGGKWTDTRTGCRAIIIKEGKILLSYEAKTDQWMLPGGGLEKNEAESACVIRETAEETGFVITPSACLLEIDEYYENWKYVNRYFTGQISDVCERNLTEREKEVGMEPRWLPVADILGIWAKHHNYAGIDEMRRGMYLREYTALRALLAFLAEWEAEGILV